MRKDTALLIIDLQNDFTRRGGALFVEGAEESTENLCNLVSRNLSNIDHITMTQDSHHPMDSAHPIYWKDKDGNNPNPFTSILSSDIEGGKWIPQMWPQATLDYLRALENDGEFTHTIWPEHCIIGTEGHNIDSRFMPYLLSWAREGRYVNFVSKGAHPLVEHYGAMRANVEIPGEPSTQFNQALFNNLNQYRVVYVAGQAKTHCLANTIRQLMRQSANNNYSLLKKIILLEDCTNDIIGPPGLEDLFTKVSDPIYAEAVSHGLRIMKSTQVDLTPVHA